MEQAIQKGNDLVAHNLVVPADFYISPSEAARLLKLSVREIHLLQVKGKLTDVITTPGNHFHSFPPVRQNRLPFRQSTLPNTQPTCPFRHTVLWYSTMGFGTAQTDARPKLYA